MNHSVLNRTIGILVILGVLFSSGQAAPAAPEVSVIIIPGGSPIQIAAATWYGHSGYQDHFNAVQMAVDDFGAIQGFNVQVNQYDDGCSAATGGTSAQAIAGNTQNLGVIGPLCSSSTMGALPFFEGAHLPMISPSNTHADLASYGMNSFNRVVVFDPYFDQYWHEQVEELSGVEAWNAAFEAQFGHAPDEYAKFAYDATRLLLTRIEQVSSLSAPNLTIVREELQTAVRNTFNFPGVTGAITLERDGDRVNKFWRMVWDDTFSLAQLNPRWSWINEQPGGWSLTAKPGFLRIIAKPVPQRLVQPAPKGNFEIATMVNFTPNQNFQLGGLLVSLDNDNFLSLERAYCDLAPPTCEGNAIYFDFVEDGAFSGANFATVFAETGRIWLRIERMGNAYHGYASSNGTDWQLIGVHHASFSPEYVGLIAGNDQGSLPADIPADFDYFILETIIGPVSLPFISR
jgi:regulation of enolase protein 1 (concanavalin A-like superfamily)